LPTSALTGVFMNLYDKVDDDNYLYSIQNALLQRKGAHGFPTNAEIVNALKEKDFYNIKSNNRIYFWERIENYQNKEYVKIDTNITIEHIFPQTPDPKWKVELDAEEYNYIKDNYLNIVGNLTLSGNNGALGNKPFVEKRDMNIDGKEQGYKYSRFWLNRGLQEKTLWNRQEIEERTKMITDRFMKVWEYPDIQLKSDLASGEVNIFEADDPTHRKLEYYVFFDQRVEAATVTQLFCDVFKQLFDLQPELFFNTAIKDKIYLSNNSDVYGNRDCERLNDTYFMCTNYSSVYKIEVIKETLSIFNLEDELFIKYAE
jgi:hypothetical protein